MNNEDQREELIERLRIYFKEDDRVKRRERQEKFYHEYYIERKKERWDIS
jgi:hypothetical protein